MLCLILTLKQRILILCALMQMWSLINYCLSCAAYSSMHMHFTIYRWFMYQFQAMCLLHCIWSGLIPTFKKLFYYSIPFFYDVFVDSMLTLRVIFLFFSVVLTFHLLIQWDILRHGIRLPLYKIPCLIRPPYLPRNCCHIREVAFGENSRDKDSWPY